MCDAVITALMGLCDGLGDVLLTSADPPELVAQSPPYWVPAPEACRAQDQHGKNLFITGGSMRPCRAEASFSCNELSKSLRPASRHCSAVGEDPNGQGATPELTWPEDGAVLGPARVTSGPVRCNFDQSGPLPSADAVSSRMCRSPAVHHPQYSCASRLEKLGALEEAPIFIVSASMASSLEGLQHVQVYSVGEKLERRLARRCSTTRRHGDTAPSRLGPSLAHRAAPSTTRAVPPRQVPLSSWQCEGSLRRKNPTRLLPTRRVMAWQQEKWLKESCTAAPGAPTAGSGGCCCSCFSSSTRGRDKPRSACGEPCPSCSLLLLKRFVLFGAGTLSSGRSCCSTT